MLAAHSTDRPCRDIYNGDGVLVTQIAGGTTTRYTQDLASPLSQILQAQGATTTDYLYGLDRLAALNGSAKTWYLGDGVGSVRRTLSDASAASAPINYDPWGTVESGSVPTFGFTGEQQDVATGLVNLRARWYSTARSTFTARDPFGGYATVPYSQHPYQYTYSNPVLRRDPSGQCIPEDVPLLGEPGCRPVWELGQGPNWADGTAYVERLANDASDCGAGAFKQWAYNNTLNLAHGAAPQRGESTAMTVCRHIGNAAAAVQGAAEIIGGGGGALGGGAACVGTAGAACPVGVPVAAGGVALASHGAVLAGEALGNELGLIIRACAASNSGSSSGSGAGGAPLDSSKLRDIGQRLHNDVIQHVRSARTEAELDAALQKTGVPFVKEKTAWGEPKYIFTGYDKPG